MRDPQEKSLKHSQRLKAIRRQLKFLRCEKNDSFLIQICFATVSAGKITLFISPF